MHHSRNNGFFSLFGFQKFQRVFKEIANLAWFLSGEELREAISKAIADKPQESLVGNMVSEGTTPRRLTDLIGSLCDLTSGSGDKGTPVVYIQGYFDNYTTGM